MRGLYGKYKVEKSDGSPTDPEAVYFTLRLDTDPHARIAVRAYIASVKIENPDLAADLFALLTEIETPIGATIDNIEPDPLILMFGAILELK